jgi:hypothetical protein
MHIGRVSIENFRCIKSIDIQLSASSVIIGENNAGKTAFLDAIRIALSRRWGRSGQTGFSEYDFPQSWDAGSERPQIRIRMWLYESVPHEWPQPLVDELIDIIRTDPVTGCGSICMLTNSRSPEPAHAIRTCLDSSTTCLASQWRLCATPAWSSTDVRASGAASYVRSKSALTKLRSWKLALLNSTMSCFRPIPNSTPSSQRCDR